MAQPMAHRLAGRYEVRSLIGRGGMAEVHLASTLACRASSPSRCYDATWRWTRSSRRGSAARLSRQRR